MGKSGVEVLLVLLFKVSKDSIIGKLEANERVDEAGVIGKKPGEVGGEKK